VTVESRERFAAVVRDEHVDIALDCLLIGCEVDPDLSIDEPLRVLDRLAESVGPLDDPATALAEALGARAGFSGTASDFDDLRSSLLHEVLRRGRGLAILLSVVWTEVAHRLGVPAVCLGLPAHVMVCLGEDTVVDPFHGGVRRDIAPEPVLSPNDLLLRVLPNVRALAAGQPRSLEWARTRLWATELSLLLPRHPADLRRERGQLLVRLGQHVAGAVELETFADATPDEAAADVARRDARLARSRLN